MCWSSIHKRVLIGMFLDCKHDKGCLKSLPMTAETISMTPKKGKDESCEVEGKKYVMCRCLLGQLYLIAEITNGGNEVFRT